MGRARAYALTGDAFAEEPCCIWEPKTLTTAPASIPGKHEPEIMGSV